MTAVTTRTRCGCCHRFSFVGCHLLLYSCQLLLRPQLACVAALLLATVACLAVHPCVALPADHLVAVVFARKNHQRRLYHAATQAKNQVEGGLLLDVVVRQRAAVLQLLASKDEAL